MNYRALNDYCKKFWIYNYQPWNVWQSIPSMVLIVIFLQFYLKSN